MEHKQLWMHCRYTTLDGIHWKLDAKTCSLGWKRYITGVAYFPVSNPAPRNPYVRWYSKPVTVLTELEQAYEIMPSRRAEIDWRLDNELE